MVALFLFLKGMTGALAPFSYLIFKYTHKDRHLLHSLRSCKINKNKQINFSLGTRF
jgi:hypothetical protein